jgi:hypothetical protein
LCVERDPVPVPSPPPLAGTVGAIRGLRGGHPDLSEDVIALAGIRQREGGPILGPAPLSPSPHQTHPRHGREGDSRRSGLTWTRRDGQILVAGITRLVRGRGVCRLRGGIVVWLHGGVSGLGTREGTQRLGRSASRSYYGILVLLVLQD